MTNQQDTNSTADAVPGESLKDGAENKASQISTSDALSDGSLDDVSGGSWPYGTAARAAYSSTGGGG